MLENTDDGDLSVQSVKVDPRGVARREQLSAQKIKLARFASILNYICIIIHVDSEEL